MVDTVLGFGVPNQLTGEETYPVFHISCISLYVTLNILPNILTVWRFFWFGFISVFT